MTMRQPPVLDRLITATVTVTVPGLAKYSFLDRLDDPKPGSWQFDGQDVVVGVLDAKGPAPSG